MPKTYCFYMDDSGSRKPDRNPSPSRERDYFSLGGVVLDEEQEPAIREAHAAFCATWSVTSPLRSYDIRQKAKGFGWLRNIGKPIQAQFYKELGEFLCSVPVSGLACVIDRPGHNARYRKLYGPDRWLLCKTAFAIAVERAAKYAQANGAKLRVFVERSSRTEDRMLARYYEALKSDGMPFNEDRQSGYQPLSAGAFRETLYEFRLKKKSSTPMQIADLYLFPMAMGGYDAAYGPYLELKQSNRLRDCSLQGSEISELGIKYSCFDSV